MNTAVQFAFTNCARRQPGRAYSRYESRKQVCRARHGDPAPSAAPRGALRLAASGRRAAGAPVAHRPRREVLDEIALRTPRASLLRYANYSRDRSHRELFAELYPNWIDVFTDYD